MRLLSSTTFQFCFLILFVSGIAAYNTGDLTWKDWLDASIYLIGIYAGKEGVRYGSDAYRNKNSV